MKEKSKSLYAYIYNVCALSESIQHTLINFFNLNTKSINFIEIETSVDLDEDAFISYLKEHGFPSDAKLKLYRDAYPVSCTPDYETYDIKTIEFQGGISNAGKTNGSTETNETYAGRDLH